MSYDPQGQMECVEDLLRAIKDKMPVLDDAYWLRHFAAAAMQGLLNNLDQCYGRDPGSIENRSVQYAQALLAEIKRVESK